jgi:hypothetical protein
VVRRINSAGYNKDLNFTLGTRSVVKNLSKIEWANFNKCSKYRNSPKNWMEALEGHYDRENRDDQTELECCLYEGDFLIDIIPSF